MTSMTNWQLGQWGEHLIQQKYEQHHYTLCQRNFQYYLRGTQGRQGEIDLIFYQEARQLLVLVEVKTRSNQKFGKALEQITSKQLQNLYHAYLFFLRKNPHFENYFMRFDVATVESHKIEIFPGAYTFDHML